MEDPCQVRNLCRSSSIYNRLDLHKAGKGCEWVRLTVGVEGGVRESVETASAMGISCSPRATVSLKLGIAHLRITIILQRAP